MADSETTPLPGDVAKPSAVEIQQDYYETIGSVDWELFEKADRKYLLQKIAVAMVGPPTIEGNLENEQEKCKESDEDTKKDPKEVKENKSQESENEVKLQGYELRDEEIIMKVFEKICEQAKYSHDGENILIKVLRVVCVIPKEEVPFFKITPSNYWLDLHDKKGDFVHTYIFHVFCTRQCISVKQGVSGCKVFIDHNARVYKDWDDFLSNNQLPKSVMVVPKNGQYSGTFGPHVDLMQPEVENMIPLVELSVVPSPALGVGAKVLSVADTISTVANVGAIFGIVGAIVAPVIAPVAIGTAIGVGVATGTYAIVRGSITLADRSKHEQSIGFADSESRNAWINILVSALGISCSAAGRLLAWAATTGTDVKILINAVQILQYTNLGTGFIGVVNSLGEMIYKYHKYEETPSKLELFQFSTSVLFLGIGVMSNQTAKEIVQDAQANKINEVRESLTSNNKKKMFDKITAETRRTKGTIQGNTEVIKALKKIDNKDEFFGKLRGMNKQLNKNKLRISLSSDGNPLINNQHNIGVAELQALGRKGRNQLFSKYGPAKVDSKNVPTRIYASNATACTTSMQVDSFTIGVEEMIKITNFIMSLSRIDQDFIAELLSDMSASFHDAFLLICAEIIASLVPSEIDKLLGLDRHYKVRIVLFAFDYLKSKIVIDNADDNVSFKNVLKKYVRDGKIPKETILEIKNTLFSRIQTRENKIFDDPHLFDIMHNYDIRNKNILTIQAGEILKLGKHDILVKNSTIDKLDEWFQFYYLSQSKCEAILKLSFEIISILTAAELFELSEINPDDDMIKIVVHFLLFVTNDLVYFPLDELPETDLLTDIASELKRQLKNWRSYQILRKYETCKICQGRRYKD